MKNLTKVAASGYFDPIHSGHIEYLRLARDLGNELVSGEYLEEDDIERFDSSGE